jgi:alpha-glucosidase
MTRRGFAAATGRVATVMGLGLFAGCPGTPAEDAGTSSDVGLDASGADAPALDAGPPDASLLDARSEGGGSFTLEDGTRVSIDDEGTIALFRADDSALTTTHAPALRTFSRSARMTLGMYTVTRRDESTHPLFFSRASAEADGVHARYVDPRGGELVMVVRVGVANERTSISVEPAGTTHDAVVLSFGCDAEASFLGFGEQYDALDHRGERLELFSSEQGIGRVPGRPRSPTNGDRHTTYFPMPYWLDLRGHGVLLDADARMQADLCAAEASRASVEVETRDAFAIEVLHGPSPMRVIEELGDLVGRPARPPAWAFSPWIGIQGGRAAVLAERDRLRAERIPFSALWAQDWSGRREFTPGRFGVDYRWVPDETLYPDLAGMVDELHADGVRFLAYANPFVVTTNLHFTPMAEAGLLIADDTDAPYTFTSVFTMASIPDFSRPETYAYVEGFLRTMTRAEAGGGLGIDGWMADFGEWIPPDARFADGRDGMQAHAGYPRSWHRASREAFDAERPDGDWVMFTRSGWTRSHDTVQIVWVGDQEADFSEHDGLPTVLPAMLSLGLSGIPFVTHDVAGFSGGPSTKELFQRWTELGAFTPIFRTHEGLMRTANWRWSSDAETTTHFRRFARIHELLAPELAALADEAATTSRPMLRALALVFPDDPGSRAVIDEMLLGDTLLVAPVVTEGTTRRSVYLPPGTWFHVWSGERFEGARTIEVDCPIGSPPVFSRDVDRPDLRDPALSTP